MEKRNNFDVIIIGAGMAGSCLARQLRLHLPQLTVMNLDQKKDFDYWVGESTVEAWEDYMSRYLQLGPFLEKRFMQKHGLRIFFDNKEKSLSMSELSEFGRSHYHNLPARQVDRAVFDREMCEMNKALGVDVRLGLKVNDVEVSKEKGHVVKTSEGDFKCKWLIDASGRSSIVARKFAKIEKETRNDSASYWVRYKNPKILDHLGDNNWKKRVTHTSRYSSTNHFSYEGYWIWHIPLSENIVSLGVEFNREKTDLGFKSGEELTKWFKSHKALSQILEGAEILDFKALTSMPRSIERHFTDERCYVTGMAGTFIDVMGSGTSRIYSECNRLVEELIRTELSGDEKLLKSQLQHFNLHMKGSYEAHLRSLKNYEWYGSFDLWPAFFGAGLAKYFNSTLPHCITDLKELKDKAKMHVNGCQCDIHHFRKTTIEKGLNTAFFRVATEFYEFLKREDKYYANNKGNYQDSLFWEGREGVEEKIYEPRDLENEMKLDKKIYEDLFKHYVKKMCEHKNVKFVEATFEKHFESDWDKGQTLDDVFQKLATTGKKAVAGTRNSRIAA